MLGDMLRLEVLANHLARGGHGEGVDELHLARVLVRGKLALHVRLDARAEGRVERSVGRGGTTAVGGGGAKSEPNTQKKKAGRKGKTPRAKKNA